MRSTNSTVFSSLPRLAILLPVLFGILAAAGCKKTETGTNPVAPGTPAGGSYRFAFVTNNSSDFWNIAEKGLRKAGEGFRRQGRHVPPPQGRGRRPAAVPGRHHGAELRRRGHQPHQPRRDDRDVQQGGGEDAARLSRLGRAEVEAQRLRRDQQRRGRARRRRGRDRGAQGRQRHQGQDRALRGSHRHAERDRAQAGHRRDAGEIAGVRDSAGVPRQDGPGAGQEKRRGRPGPLSRSGAHHGHLVVQRPRAWRAPSARRAARKNR